MQPAEYLYLGAVLVEEEESTTVRAAHHPLTCMAIIEGGGGGGQVVGVIGDQLSRRVVMSTMNGEDIGQTSEMLRRSTPVSQRV